MPVCVLPAPCWQQKPRPARSATLTTDGPFQLSRQINARGVQTYIWPADPTANPNPIFLHVRRADTGPPRGRRGVSHLSQLSGTKSEVLPGQTRVHTPTRGWNFRKLGSKWTEHRARPGRLCGHLRLLPGPPPGQVSSHPPRGPSFCWQGRRWPCSALWIFTCHRRLTLIPPKSPHTVLGKHSEAKQGEVNSSWIRAAQGFAAAARPSVSEVQIPAQDP